MMNRWLPLVAMTVLVAGLVLAPGVAFAYSTGLGGEGCACGGGSSHSPLLTLVFACSWLCGFAVPAGVLSTVVIWKFGVRAVGLFAFGLGYWQCCVGQIYEDGKEDVLDTLANSGRFKASIVAGRYTFAFIRGLIFRAGDVLVMSVSASNSR